jgi:hypothetical protein
MKNGRSNGITEYKERVLNMKPTTIFLALLLALGLLIGCGGNGDNGGINGNGNGKQLGEACTADEECAGHDDPCEPLACLGPPMDKHCLQDCLAQGPDDPCCSEPFCNTRDICIDTMTYEVSITEVSQQPEECFVDQDILNALLLLPPYPITLPIASAYPTDIKLPVSSPGLSTAPAELVNGELVIGPVTADFIQLTVPNCTIGGTASGSTSGFDTDSIQITIEVTEIEVSEGTGQGSCTLETPEDPCTIRLVSEGPKQ